MRRLSAVSLFLSAALAFAGCAHTPVPTQKDLEAAEIHYDLGVNAVNNGRIQEALKEFQSAVRMNPSLPEAHNALGLVLHWSFGRLDEARRHFDKALELRPSYPEAENNLGTLLAAQGDVQGARAAFERALADPLYTTPYIAQANLAWVVHLQGDSETGERLARAALIAKPDYCMGHRQLARLLDAKGESLEAEAHWEAFARHCPEEPEALLRMAALHVQRGQPVDAARALRTCLEKAGARPIAADCRTALRRLPPLPEEPEPAPAPAERTPVVRGARDLIDSTTNP